MRESRDFTTSIDNLPLVLTVDEAGKILRIGRNAAYDLVRCGLISSIRVAGQFGYRVRQSPIS